MEKVGGVYETQHPDNACHKDDITNQVRNPKPGVFVTEPINQARKCFQCIPSTPKSGNEQVKILYPICMKKSTASFFQNSNIILRHKLKFQPAYAILTASGHYTALNEYSIMALCAYAIIP